MELFKVCPEKEIVWIMGRWKTFFVILKTEMFYGQEDNYKTIDELIIAIDEYINYYNYNRIKVKLKL